MGKRIITYGTFDMFHIGHLNLFKRMKELGDTLIVGISTDEFNSGKGKKSLIPFEQRSQIVSSIKYVDMVIPEISWDQKIEDIIKHQVDIFAIGHDWKGKFDFLRDYCDVIYLDRTEGISTSDIKKSLGSFLSISKEDVVKAFEVLQSLKRDLA